MQRLNVEQRRSSFFALGIALFTLATVGWLIELECASLGNNYSPDDCTCLKSCLEDAKVHQVILQRSKIYMLSQKRVLKILRQKI